MYPHTCMHLPGRSQLEIGQPQTTESLHWLQRAVLLSGARSFSGQPWGEHLLILQHGIPGPWCRTTFYVHADVRCHVAFWVSALLWGGILLLCLNIILYRVVSCFVLRSTNAHAKDLQRQVVACIFLLFAVFKLKKIFSSSTLSRMWVSGWMKEK